MTKKNGTITTLLREIFGGDHPPAEVIVRDVNDSTYPEQGPPRRLPDGSNISTWQTVEFEGMAPDGVIVHLGGATSSVAVEHSTQKWVPVDRDVTVDPEQFELVTAYLLGRVLFEEIQDAAPSSATDERIPHLFVRYEADGGRPWVRLYQVNGKFLDGDLYSPSLLRGATAVN